MDSRNLDVQHRAMFRDFLSSNHYDSTGFNETIAADDEMFHKAILPGYENSGDAYMAYMQSGKRMLDVFRQLVGHAFGGGEISVLEFAGGYGRFTRHLLTFCNPQRLVTSDIYRQAVDWQHQHHQITGIYSCPDPQDYALVSGFDVIFVGSLFSHLPRDLFKAWLARLFAMLTPNGLIAFSVHDLQLAAAAGAEMDESGEFGYSRFSESDSLSLDIYGMTYVSESYVSNLVREVCGDTVSLRRFAKGLYENQDLYLLSRQAQSTWKDFELFPAPIGGFSGSWIEGDCFHGSGWALAMSETPHVLSASVLIDNMEVCTTDLVDDDSGEVERFFPGIRSIPQRFRFNLPLSGLKPGAVVKCRISNVAGSCFDVYLGIIPARA